MQLLIFRMGKETYGFRLSDVSEVVAGISILELPRIPPPFEGIFQLRGRIVALLNLPACFSQQDAAEESEVLILEPQSFAIRVPGLVESVQIGSDDLQSSAEEGIGLVMEGIVCENQEIYHVLSAAKLLNHVRKLISDAEESSQVVGG